MSLVAHLNAPYSVRLERQVEFRQSPPGTFAPQPSRLMSSKIRALIKGTTAEWASLKTRGGHGSHKCTAKARHTYSLLHEARKAEQMK